MDPTIGWYQPEQFGPAKDLWLNIWETEKSLDVLSLRNNDDTLSVNAMNTQLQQDLLALDPNVATSNATLSTTNFGIGNDNCNGNTRAILGNGNNNVDRLPHNGCHNYYNPSRRKSDNRASTYDMNYNYHTLVGGYGGCPWRIPNKHYSKGVIG